VLVQKQPVHALLSTQDSGPTRSFPPRSDSRAVALVADAGCGSLHYAASEIGHLLVSEVLDGEARLLQLVTDIHGGQDRVDRRSQFGQRVADERVIERGRPVLCGLQQPRAQRLRSVVLMVGKLVLGVDSHAPGRAGAG